MGESAQTKVCDLFYYWKMRSYYFWFCSFKDYCAIPVYIYMNTCVQNNWNHHLHVICKQKEWSAHLLQFAFTYIYVYISVGVCIYIYIWLHMRISTGMTTSTPYWYNARNRHPLHSTCVYFTYMCAYNRIGITTYILCMYTYLVTCIGVSLHMCIYEKWNYPIHSICIWWTESTRHALSIIYVHKPVDDSLLYGLCIHVFNKE